MRQLSYMMPLLLLSVGGEVSATATEPPYAGTPVSDSASVTFADGSSVFRPTPEAIALLADVWRAAAVYVSGRTSTNRPSASDEALAMRRALAARQYLIARGVSPLKIMVNFASAADFVSDNSSPEGRRENQRVDIEIVYVQTY